MANFGKSVYKPSKRASASEACRRHAFYYTINDEPSERRKSENIPRETQDNDFVSKESPPQISSNLMAVEDGQKSRKSFNFENISVQDLKRSIHNQIEDDEKKESNGKETESTFHSNQTRKESLLPLSNLNSSLLISTTICASMYTKDAKKFEKEIGKSIISKDKLDLNKSVSMKKSTGKDFGDVSVKDLAISLVRQKLQMEEESARPKSKDGKYAIQDGEKDVHEHCRSCYDENCTQNKHCSVIKCRNRCGMAYFHQCKQAEHDELCRCSIIPCVNKTYGCKMEMPRYTLAYHLQHCHMMRQGQRLLQEAHQGRPKSQRSLRNAVSCNIDRNQESLQKHSHCRSCIKADCKENTLRCSVQKCQNKGCEVRLHRCKQKDHKRICLFSEINCINAGLGCPYTMTRILLKEHLQGCTAMDFTYLNRPSYNLWNHQVKRHHCETCIKADCTVDVMDECKMVECFCGLRFHQCKNEDHSTICPIAVVRCINFLSGCSMILTRSMMTTHLLHCPFMGWACKEKLLAFDDSEFETLAETFDDETSGMSVDKNSEEHLYQSLRKYKKKKAPCEIM